MTQMLRFKVKTTPNKTTVRKMLQALFLQHFNGFILHGTFVVCQEIYIIFSKIKFFPLEYCYCFCCYSKCTARKRQYIRLKVVATKVFVFFLSTKSEQTAIQQSHIINPLLTSSARSVRESIAFGFYRTDLAPSSLGLYENLRQYFPVQTSHSVNKSLIYIRRPLHDHHDDTFQHAHVKARFPLNELICSRAAKTEKT